jgi:hypothetical protein
MQNPAIQDRLTLSHAIGRQDRGFTMLGEGNTSARLGDDSFAVKASGTCLGSPCPFMLDLDHIFIIIERT